MWNILKLKDRGTLYYEGDYLPLYNILILNISQCRDTCPHLWKFCWAIFMSSYSACGGPACDSGLAIVLWNNSPCSLSWWSDPPDCFTQFISSWTGHYISPIFLDLRLACICIIPPRNSISLQFIYIWIYIKTFQVKSFHSSEIQFPTKDQFLRHIGSMFTHVLTREARI